jgi:hypothetical protein
MAEYPPIIPTEIAPTIAHHWRQNTPLNAVVLEHLQEINRIYLNFLVINLDPARRPLLARCPFSLFTARFHDGHFWSAQASATSVRDSAVKLASDATSNSRTTAFTELALFYAWHLVQSNPLAARILLGMAEQTITAFRQISLRRLQQLASEQPELVTPRWPERTAFWQGLVNATEPGPNTRLEEIRSLGIQMIAAKLA